MPPATPSVSLANIIPYVRGCEWQEWLDRAVFHTHVGVYAYRRDTLAEVTRLERSSLEKAESLEQLRWLENGYKIKTAQTSGSLSESTLRPISRRQKNGSRPKIGRQSELYKRISHKRCEKNRTVNCVVRRK